MRQAIRNRDDARAKEVYNSLLKGRTEGQINTYMKRASEAPFTGSSKAEDAFIGSLDDKQLEAYSLAREKMLDDYEVFADWLSSHGP